MEKKRYSLLFEDDNEKVVYSTKDAYQERLEPYTNSLNFKQEMSRKYILTIDSKLNLGGFVGENKVEIRWLLTSRSIDRNEFQFELITLDHAILKNTDSAYLEVHKLVAQMHKALNEITFTIDSLGNLKKVLNIENIQNRWKSVKNELMEYNKAKTSLQELFKIQDEAFEKEGGILAMVKSMEFFDIYLNDLFGRHFPYELKKDIPNLFRSAQTPFSISVKAEKQKGTNSCLIYLNSKTIQLPESFLEKAYGGFPFFKIPEINPKYNYNAVYKIDCSTGFIENADINYVEDIHEKLGGEIHYNLKSYE
jgi:hypothetical protein